MTTRLDATPIATWVAQLGHAEAGVLLLPDVEGGLADAHLPTYVRDESS